MTVFAIYCPCEPQSDAARKAVHAIYDWLHTIIAQLPERTTIVLLGDFNARTGRYNNVMQTSSVGPEYPQQENFNGQQMRYYLDSFNMSALNTWQHTAAGATYISPSGQGSRVDYVCMPRSQKHLVQKLSIWRKAGRLLQVIRTAQPRDRVPLFLKLQIDTQREQHQQQPHADWNHQAMSTPCSLRRVLQGPRELESTTKHGKRDPAVTAERHARFYMGPYQWTHPEHCQAALLQEDYFASRPFSV
ncbi:unnamed protein product [Polarella glacialis]|uniref:Endonuclease/exonuclease/phosphatase domain-containing protein n=1 Tax=Polarella glacialis TaxID=89957 RepID=A0A813JTZ3_POLGL|nr:unnamed protein product [Polarella glacialis]CAE8688757.1 unnamed protein product [Polarella glacialis]